MTTIWHMITSRVRDRMDCEISCIMRRVLEFNSVVHPWKQNKKEKIFIFGENWALNSDRRQVLLTKFISGLVGM